MAITPVMGCTKGGCDMVDKMHLACVGCGFELNERKRRFEEFKNLQTDPETGLRHIVIHREQDEGV